MINKEISEVKVTSHEAHIELSGLAQRFDLIIPLAEYDKIGRPMPGDILQITIGVVNKL